MNAPGNSKSYINYDIINNQYTLQNKVGLIKLGMPTNFSFKDESGNSHEITSHDYRYIKSYYPNVELGSHSAKKN